MKKIEKEPFVLTKAVEFRPCVTAEALKACALIGLHMVAEEATSSSLNGFSPELGDTWRYGDPSNPLWKGDVGRWTESECTSSMRCTLRMACLLPRMKG